MNSMESDKFLEQLFDKKILTIIRYFLRHPGQKFYIREIAKATRVPLATAFRIVHKLVDLNILKKESLKTSKLYSWRDNEQTKYLSFILEQKQTVLENFVEMASKLENIEAIILYGEANKESATLLIIGSQINDHALRKLVVSAKEDNNFAIKHLMLTADQFNQMSSLGLYPKQKKMLFERS